MDENFNWKQNGFRKQCNDLLNIDCLKSPLRIHRKKFADSTHSQIELEDTLTFTKDYSFSKKSGELPKNESLEAIHQSDLMLMDHSRLLGLISVLYIEDILVINFFCQRNFRRRKI